MHLHTVKAIRTVMLQIRLYVLYQRSNKVLSFLAICFLAEVTVTLYISVNFSSTVKG